MNALPTTGHVFHGRYRVVRELAAGGMGAVVQAERLEDGARVAVKFLHPELADDPEMHRRFRREASILQALDHPNVVRVFGVGDDGSGLSYTVMELLEGETLFARLERVGSLEPRELRPLLEGICSGLDAVHAHGVLHGDLKPANVFLVGDEGACVAKLVDFGTSKVHGLERLTRTGEVIGTPVYMPPELLTGDGSIDERIDTYALGVLIYQCLCGETPFTERNPGRLLFQIVMGEAVPLRTRRPELSETLEQMVSQAMSPKRESRFARANDVFAAFEKALS